MSVPRLDRLSLDVSVFRRPPRVACVDTIHVHGTELACLDSAVLTREIVFHVPFDEVLSRLTDLPQVDAEPDGFFVQTGHPDGRPWKLNGHLFELNERLWRIDLRGECPADALDRVLATAGWPAIDVLFQLVRLGVTVGEEDGRRWAVLEWTHGSRAPDGEEAFDHPLLGRPPEGHDDTKQERKSRRAEC